MKCLIIGDPHYKKDNREITELMEKAIDRVLIKNKVDFIVVLGDILDQYGQYNVYARTHCVKWLTHLSQCAETWVLIGNHDRPNNSDFLSDFHPFPNMDNENLHFVHKVVKTKKEDKTLIFVPYVKEGRFFEALSTVEIDEKIDCIFAHQEFKGCDLREGIISDHGDDIDKIKFEYEIIISGHIHKKQILNAGKIVYPGTPYFAYANEPGDQKGVMIYDFSTLRHKFIDLNLPKPESLIFDVDTFLDENLEDLYTEEFIKNITIIIKDTRDKWNTLIKTEKYKSCKLKIVFRQILSNNKIVMKEYKSLSFYERLSKRMENDERIRRVYNEVK